MLTRNASVCAGSPVEVMLEAGEYIIETSHAAFRLDAMVAASEIRLIGPVQGTASLVPDVSIGEQLDANAISSTPMLRLELGGPRLHLERLHIYGHVNVSGSLVTAAAVHIHASIAISAAGALQASDSIFDNSNLSLILEGLMAPVAANGPLQVAPGGRASIWMSVLRNSVAQLGGAVMVSGGELELASCIIEDNTVTYGGGGLAQAGGTVEASGCIFRRNRANATGGGLIVYGGDLTISESEISENHASESGGGMAIATPTASAQYVWASPKVTLSNRTALTENWAPVGSVFYNSGFDLAYALPAPDGRWVAGAFECKHYPLLQVQPCDLSRSALVGRRISLLSTGRADDDGGYPFKCAPGLLGLPNDIDAQSGPSCTSPCPEGHVCSGGTFVPVPCGVGVFCASGSPAATPCAAGSFSNSTKLTSQAGCTPCPAG
jgi:hypothetical protein